MLHNTILVATMLLINMVSNVLWLVDAGMGGVGYPANSTAEEVSPVSCFDARTASLSTGSLFIPECDEEGSFGPKQCWRGLTEECWCSDSRGNRLEDTACLETFTDPPVSSPAMSASEGLIAFPLCFVCLVLCLMSSAVVFMLLWWSVRYTTRMLIDLLPWSMFNLLRDLCRTAIASTWRWFLIFIAQCVGPFCILMQITAVSSGLYLAFELTILIYQNPGIINGVWIVVYHYQAGSNPLRFVTDLLFCYFYFFYL
eukprot:TRINITY_DN8411_c0_g1_i1.p1 TRINITY_DN8411_c0_g1~~TRINITY_DN8411_c0_g1_i1.p1  ORF type:complete len:278 (+),score=20.84 TRINITY_DN8411_c0_g1_i1:69-836(+)